MVDGGLELEAGDPGPHDAELSEAVREWLAEPVTAVEQPRTMSELVRRSRMPTSELEVEDDHGPGCVICNPARAMDLAEPQEV